MDAAIPIPIPLPGDSDTVASSLETAAVFGAKGDAVEALRWLQRAAESAGDGGDDARTLLLAQTLASLKSRVENASASDKSTDKPPARTPASNGNGASEAEGERPFLLESRAIRASTPPPPPSSRARSASPSPTPGATPAPSTSSVAAAPSPTPAARATSAAETAKVPAVRPASVAARPASNGASAASKPTPPQGTSRPPLRLTPASGTPMPPAARNSPSVTPAPPSMKAAAKSVTPSVLGAPPAAAVAHARSASVNGESASESTDAGSTTRRARQAARVSITRSLTERGLYFVRVLDEGQSPADDASEGLLVSSDPNVTLV